MSEVMITLAKEVSNVLSATEKQKSTAWSILKLCFSPSTQVDKGINLVLNLNSLRNKK